MLAPVAMRSAIFCPRSILSNAPANVKPIGRIFTRCVIQKCRAASTKVGGTGIRYTVQICGKPTFLFDEENGKWFVEAKS